MSSPRADRVVAGRRPAAVVAVAFLAALVGAGCASTSAFRAGQQAENAERFDEAVAHYTRALEERPDDRERQLSLERARLRASEAHFYQGRRLAGEARLEEALIEFQIAADLNPTSREIDDRLRETRARLRARLAERGEGQTALEAVIDRARELPPAGRDLPDDLTLPDSLVFRDASTRNVLVAIARFSGLNVIFDPAFRDSTLSIDLRDTTLENALESVMNSTRSFYTVTAENTITVAPDTPAKRREYEGEIIRTFYLSNANLEETVDLLRIVVDTRRISSISATNAITVKDTPERVQAVGRLLTAIDKARGEVVIDVELLEVDRTQLREYGLQLASQDASGTVQPGISGVADINQDGLTLADVSGLTRSDVFLFNVPGLYYRLLKRNANTRTLANPQLRTSEGIAAQARFGERVPVPVTTFAPIATGGVNQQPITSFNYENIGVNIDITPRAHHNDDVTLALRVEVSNISGTGFGGLPTFGNRTISATIRLKDGETNMLAGLIRDDERVVLEGIPGLSDLPVIGRLFARNRREAQETDVVLMITPRIVRVLDLTEEDLRPLAVRPEDLGGFDAVTDEFEETFEEPPPEDEFVAPILPPGPPPEVTVPPPPGRR